MLQSKEPATAEVSVGFAANISEAQDIRAIVRQLGHELSEAEVSEWLAGDQHEKG